MRGSSRAANAVLRTRPSILRAMSQMTKDHKIATEAFLNKEKPKFTGN